MSIIIRLQNLSWSANSLDIRQFFQGLFIPEGGVHIVGGETGDVFIAFGSDEDARQAMQKDGGKLKDMKIKLLLSSRAEMQRVIEQARTQTLLPPVVTIPPSPPLPPKETSSSSKDERSKRSPEKRRDRSRERSRDRDRSSKKSSRRSRSRSPRRNRDKDRDSDRRSKRDDKYKSGDDKYKSGDDRHKSQERSRTKDDTAQSDTSKQPSSRHSNNPSQMRSAPPNAGPTPNNNPVLKPGLDQNQRQDSPWNSNNNMNSGMGSNINSGMPMSINLNPGMAMNSNLIPGMAMSSNLNPGMALSSNLNPGMAMSSNLNAGMAMSSNLNPGMAMSSNLNPGMAMSSNLNPGMAMSSNLNPGMAMGSDLNPGMTMSSNPISGMARSSNLNSGMAINNNLNPGMPMNNINPGMAVNNMNLGMGLNKSTSSGMGLNKSTSSGMGMNNINNNSEMEVGMSSNMNSRMGMGSNMNSGIRMNSNVNPGMGMNNNMNPGMGSNMNPGMGMSNNMNPGMGMSNNVNSGMGMNNMNPGMGINNMNPGMGMNNMNPGMGMNNMNPGMGMNNNANSGMGMNNSMNSGMGMNNSMNSGAGLNTGPQNNMLQGNRAPFRMGNQMSTQNANFDQPNNNYFPRPSFGPNSGNSFNQTPGKMSPSQFGMPSNNADRRMMQNAQGMGDHRSEQNFRGNMESRNFPDAGNRPMEMSKAPNDSGIMPRGMIQDKQSNYNAGMSNNFSGPMPVNMRNAVMQDGFNNMSSGFVSEKMGPINNMNSGFGPEKMGPNFNNMNVGFVSEKMGSTINNMKSGFGPEKMGPTNSRGFVPDKMGPTNLRGSSETVRDKRTTPSSREIKEDSPFQVNSREKSTMQNSSNLKSREEPKNSHSMPDTKKTSTEPGKPNKKNTDPSQQTCIEMKGMPLFAGYSHIRDFFRGVSIPNDGIKIINNEQGQRTGSAYVRFNTEKDRLEGLKRTGNQIDKKSVTLGRVSYQTFSDAVDSFLPPGMEPPKVAASEEKQKCLMMKGLPFTCRNEDVETFFKGLRITNLIIVQNTELKRGTGYVEFSSVNDCKVAMTHNGRPMGNVYIELSVISNEEMQSQIAQKNVPLTVTNSDLVPTTCLAVHGLPVTVLDRQIADFFGETGFVPHAIHMMLGNNGKPTGDAYIEFNNPHECEAGLKRDGHMFGPNAIKILPIPHKEMVAILSGTASGQQGVQPGDTKERSMFENKPLLGGPLLNTPPRGAMDLPQSFMDVSRSPDGFMGLPDNRGEANMFPNRPDNMQGFLNGPPTRRPENRQGLLDTPKGPMEGPSGEPIDNKMVRGDPRGRPPATSFEPTGNHRGPFDNQRGQPRGGGYNEGPWGFSGDSGGFPDGPRRHSEGLRGHQDDPRGPREHADRPPRGGHRGHPDDPRGSHDINRYPEDPWGHPDGPRRHSDSLLGPMNNPRPGLLDNARGRPLLGDGMEQHGRLPLLDDPRGPVREGPPDTFQSPEGKRKGRPLLEFSDPSHFNPDEQRRHDGHLRNRQRGNGDFNLGGPEDHPAHMDHGNGPKPYNRGSGPLMPNPGMTQNVDGFGQHGCIVGVTNVPYRATTDDILMFFEGFGLNQDNVIRRFDASGRVTGDVRIAFHTPDDAHRAITELDGAVIRGRNVSLFMP